MVVGSEDDGRAFLRLGEVEFQHRLEVRVNGVCNTVRRESGSAKEQVCILSEMSFMFSNACAAFWKGAKLTRETILANFE